MKLNDVLDERIIDMHVQAENKDEALTVLAQRLKDANYINDVCLLYTSMFLLILKESVIISNSLSCVLNNCFNSISFSSLYKGCLLYTARCV